MNIRINSVRYQRNGICGVGFFAVTFEHDGRAMAGMVVMRGDDDPARTRSTKFCGVMDPNDPTVCWRGDHFDDVLLSACLAASESGSAFREAA